MYKRFDCGWNLGSWRVRAAGTEAILSAVESLGREYFAHVEIAETEAEEGTGDAVDGKAAGKEKGTAVIEALTRMCYEEVEVRNGGHE